MDEDEEDYVFYGTPIEREEETSSRKRKAVADAGQLRTLPAWKQEVTDEEGRRRFHGAFTGGFSAGYYNTVGSKEGWTPQTFTSSRKNRAELKQQSIYSFLDDEDKKDIGGHELETSHQFDTFGFTAAEVARKQAEKEQQKRPSAIPGPVPDELVVPATNSIGVKLLIKMGWRHGHSIRETHADSLYDARREARKAFLAFSGNERGSEPSQAELSRSDSEDCIERCNDGLYASRSTPVYVRHPKHDLHGLGYDPFKHAPEFRDWKRLHESRNQVHGRKHDLSMRGNLLASNSGKYAPGFGIGALEELDVEDEDIYASGFEFVGTEVEEVEPSIMVKDDKHKLEYRKEGVLSGFKVASSSEYNLERFHPPVIPPGYEPRHTFPFPLETLDDFDESPPEVPPPEDHSLKLLIEGFATLVARCGKLFEDLSKEKNKSNPLFSFLSGGSGHNYYERKLWEAKRRSKDQKIQVDMKSISSDRKMTAESRGRILGEKPLERSSNDSDSSVSIKEVIHLQSNLSDTFTKPASRVEFAERSKPFKDDPAKQERFEKFLKEKYHGGLRSTDSGGTATMSESDRARERLDFEAAAEAISKEEWKTETNVPLTQQFMGSGDWRFASAGVEILQISQDEEKMSTKIYPKREEFQWRPSPILCKRFDLIDPFMGKPPPLPRPRKKMDALIFMPDSVVNVKSQESDATAIDRDLLGSSQSEPQKIGNQLSPQEPDIEPDPTSVQRPVDLYKAIFSDDSDEENGNASFQPADGSEKKTEGANTTLNRLIAGDFLESLGKELGLEVPSLETRSPFNKTNSLTSLTETVGKADIKISSSLVDEDVTIRSASLSKVCPPTSKEAGPSAGNGSHHANSQREMPSISSFSAEADGRFSNRKGEGQEHKKDHRSRSRRHSTHSSHRMDGSSTSDTDSSSDHCYYDRTKPRSKGRSRKNSSHGKHKRSRSPIRYSSHDNGRDFSDDKRKDRRSKDRGRHSQRDYH